jgi:hypothetical protein
MTDNDEAHRHDRTALILYGSETGNSQDVADELGRMAERLHFVTRVSDTDAVEIVCPLSNLPGPILDNAKHCLFTPESAIKVLGGYLRHFNHRPRRVSSKFPQVLEKSS